MSAQNFDFEIVHQQEGKTGKFSIGNLNSLMEHEPIKGLLPNIPDNFHMVIKESISLLLMNNICEVNDPYFKKITTSVISGSTIVHDNWKYPLGRGMFMTMVPKSHDMYMYLNYFTSEKPTEFSSADLYNKSYLTINILIELFNINIQISLKPMLLRLPNTKNLKCSALKWHAGTIRIVKGSRVLFQYIRWTMNFHERYGDLCVSRISTNPVQKKHYYKKKSETYLR